MSVVTEKELTNYFKQIDKAMSASSKKKKGMLRGLQNGIDEYIGENPDATMEDIRAHFGEPADVATEYISDVTPKDVERFTRRKKIILGLSLGLVVLVIGFTVIYFSLVWKTPGVIKEAGKFEMSNINESAVVDVY